MTSILTKIRWDIELPKHPDLIQLVGNDGKTKLWGISLQWYALHSYIPQLPKSREYIELEPLQRDRWLTAVQDLISSQTIKGCNKTEGHYYG
jgi:hypothetical protein